MSRLRSLAAGVLLTLAASAAPLADARAVDVERVVSPGGIEAWLVRNDGVPVISMDFAFRGGTASDPEGKAGLANLAAATLDEGAGTLRSRAFRSALRDRGIRLDFDARRDTFHGSVQTVTEHAETAFDLTRLALNEPRFDAEAVERMRAAILAAVRRNTTDPEWLARRAYADTVYADHPYGQPSRGTAATLAGLTAADLRAFVDERLVKDRLFIGVSGDITAEELGPLLDQVFGGLPDSGPALEVPALDREGAGEVVQVDWDGPQSVLLIGQPGVGREDVDYYPAIVMNQVLGGGGLTSRLGEEVREKRGLTYGISSYLVDSDHADELMVSGSLSNANVVEALDVIATEWRRMAEEGPTVEEFDDAKTYLTGSFPLRFTSTGRVASSLLGMQLDGLGIDYLDERNRRVEAVTLEQVNTLAGRLLDTAAWTVVVVGEPTGDFEPTGELSAADLAARELAEGGS